jgi:hypothetical protein
MLLIVILFFSAMVLGFVSLKTVVNKHMAKSVKDQDCVYIKNINPFDFAGVKNARKFA